MKKIYKMKVYRQGFLSGFGKGAILSALFFRNLPVTIFAGLGGGIYGIGGAGKNYQKKQNEEITLQFKEGLQGIASALGAGYSMENAFEEAKKDLMLLYGEDALLVQEFCWIQQQLSLNRALESVLFEFAQRWQAEDILHFAQVLQTAKRTGGDFISITRAAANKIAEKIEAEREIHAMLAGKKMEAQIMNGIPLGMILYFWICSPGFLDCMYTGIGRGVMGVLLVVYLAAYRWSIAISNIKI